MADSDAGQRIADNAVAVRKSVARKVGGAKKQATAPAKKIGGAKKV